MHGSAFSTKTLVHIISSETERNVTDWWNGDYKFRKGQKKIVVS